MEHTIKNLQSSNLYSKEELNRLEQQAILLHAMRISKKEREKKKLKIAARITYSVLIGILGGLFYLAFVVLEIPNLLILK